MTQAYICNLKIALKEATTYTEKMQFLDLIIYWRNWLKGR